MLVCFIAFLLPTTTVNYAAHYGHSYQKAQKWVQEHRSILQVQADSHGLETTELTAIIFPELIRYSEWQNLLETEALALAYVEKGVTWADFSIGAFQMKPSFAEALEHCLQGWPEGRVAFSQLLPQANHTPREQRKARLNRLCSVQGQVQYLCAFVTWMQTRPGFYLVTSTPAQKITLLATAYNSGFKQDWPTLQWVSQQHFFPYGAKYPQEGQHAYAAVALDYYQQSAPLPYSWLLS